MTSLNIYKVILLILNSIYTAFEQMSDCWLFIKRNIFETQGPVLQEKFIFKIQRLEKIPNHLTVLLGLEKPSCKDLANLVLWCLSAGIPFISFYDHEGFIQSQEEDLRNTINQLKSPEDKIIWNSKYNEKSDYSCNKGCIKVKTLSAKDGRNKIVQTTKELASTCSSKDITVNFVNECLQKHYEFPDPHLGIYCGKYFSVYGYPPWQIRFTEFINVQTYKDITQQCFYNILRIFSKVEQKLGK